MRTSYPLLLDEECDKLHEFAVLESGSYQPDEFDRYIADWSEDKQNQARDYFYTECGDHCDICGWFFELGELEAVKDDARMCWRCESDLEDEEE